MALSGEFSFRAVKASDHKAYTETLAVLTTVGAVSEDDFAALVNHWAKYPEIYNPTVIVNRDDQVVATGMLLVEQKLIHGCGKVGHIEDIAVAKSQQGMKLGNLLIQHLSELAQAAGCYKVILDCSPENVGFYEKCGYKNAGVEMTRRYD